MPLEERFYFCHALTGKQCVFQRLYFYFYANVAQIRVALGKGVAARQENSQAKKCKDSVGVHSLEIGKHFGRTRKSTQKLQPLCQN